MTLERSFPSVFPAISQSPIPGNFPSDDPPDMPCQMLAPGEAQIAGRKVGAVEFLSLFLFGRPTGLSIDALIVRSRFSFIRHVHVDILRDRRPGRRMGVAPTQDPGGGLVCGEKLRRKGCSEWGGWKRSLPTQVAKAQACRRGSGLFLSYRGRLRL